MNIKKYSAVMSCELKNAVVYRGSTWLRAGLSVVTVALAYLLWSAVFRGADHYEGFTLPEMTTYYLLGGILSALTLSDGLLHEFSHEIKTGGYAKYMVRPVSPLLYFVSASFARAALPMLSKGVVLTAGMLLLSRYFSPLSALDVLGALPVIFLGGVLNMLIQFIIAMFTFRLTDIGFIFVVQHIVVSFFSGSLLPLDMVFGDGFAQWLPFSYTLYYPVLLCMGKADISAPYATLILLGWLVVFAGVCALLVRRSPRRFEGVGM